MVIIPDPAAGIDPSGFAPYVPGVPHLPGPIDALSQADLLAVGEGVLPANYVQPLKDTGPGHEMLQAFAAQNARASLAVANAGGGMFISSASGESRATVAVQLSRPVGPALIAVTVKSGSIFSTTHGHDFRLLYDVVFGAADVGPHTGYLEALRPGWEWNVRGQRTSAAGETLAGEITKSTKLIEEPPWGEPNIIVSQVDDAVGGRYGMLDGLGADRGMSRLSGEGDDAYRYRLRMLPDVVTPEAIWRQVSAYMASLSSSWSIVETWEPTIQMCYDADLIPDEPLEPDNETWHNTFVYDGGYDDRYCNVYLDDGSAAGAFVVVLPFLPSGIDCSMVYDDTVTLEGEYQTSLGWRAVGTYDQPEAAVLSAPQGAYDGSDFGEEGHYAGLWDLLQAIKAAGVAVHFARF